MIILEEKKIMTIISHAWARVKDLQKRRRKNKLSREDLSLPKTSAALKIFLLDSYDSWDFFQHFVDGAGATWFASRFWIVDDFKNPWSICFDKILSDCLYDAFKQKVRMFAETKWNSIDWHFPCCISSRIRCVHSFKKQKEIGGALKCYWWKKIAMSLSTHCN